MVAQDWIDKDFYKVLGVSKKASADEIKKAYRKLTKELHPDVNPDNAKAEKRYKEVTEAYSVVGNEAKRKEYDEARQMFGSGGFRFPGGGAPGQPGGGASANINLDDLLRGAGGGLGDLFGGMFGRGGAGGTTTRRPPRRGSDIESEVTIAFDDSLDGVTVPLRLASESACEVCRGTGAKAGTTPRVCVDCEGTGHITRNQGGFAVPEPCPKCRGRGLVVDNPCPTCHGSGRGMSSRVVQARIPAGVRDGQRIRLKGKGAPGEFGGPNGDLFVKVHVSPHPVFGRSHDNLTVTVPVTFTEAALGAEIPVPVPGGTTVTLKIPAGTANGRTFRVRGRGARGRDGQLGDLLVTVEVAVPENIGTKERKLLKEYAGLTSTDDPREHLLAKAAKAAAQRQRPEGGQS